MLSNRRNILALLGFGSASLALAPAAAAPAVAERPPEVAHVEGDMRHRFRFLGDHSLDDPGIETVIWNGRDWLNLRSPEGRKVYNRIWGHECPI